MQRERRSWRKILLWAVALLLFVQALNLIMPARLAPVGPFNLLARFVIGAAAGFTETAGHASASWRKYLDNADAVSQLEALRHRHDQLKFEYELALRHIAIRRDLDEMLGWTFLPWRGVLARVVFHDPAHRFGTAWIQVPEAADVTGHAVAEPAGLLGRIVDQVGRYAQVLLVSDVESAVDATTSDGIRAVVRGTGGRGGQVDYVPRYEPLAVGQVLWTSGRDGVYPAGVSVGTIEAIERNAEQVYLKAQVRFAVDPSRATWVRTLSPEADLP